MEKYDRHICEYQPSNIIVEYSRDTFHEDFTWQVTYFREAAEEDLENNHYLETVGETLWSLVAEINNCPYCGLSLREQKNNNGEHVLFDSTGGSINVL